MSGWLADVCDDEGVKDEGVKDEGVNDEGVKDSVVLRSLRPHHSVVLPPFHHHAVGRDVPK